jgi:hypothetical protein
MTGYNEHRLNLAAKRIARLDADLRFLERAVTWGTIFLSVFAIALFCRVFL